MISEHIQKLLEVAENSHTPEYLIAAPNEPCIEVGHLISHAAQYYEKARYAVDYKEEHVLRRAAIERILKRRLTLTLSLERNGQSLVEELIQAGYLPNDELPESLADKVQHIIDKTVFLTSLIRRTHPGERQSVYEGRLILLATSEIEDFLFPTPIDEATVDAFFRSIKDYVKILNTAMPESEQEIQIYLACRRGLLSNDDGAIFYRLWLMHYPDWQNINSDVAGNKETLQEIAVSFVEISKLIDEQIKTPLHQRLVPKIKNDTIYFSFIRAIVNTQREQARDFFEEEKLLLGEVRRQAEETYAREETRISKSAWRAVFYIFLTKIILAFAIELPYDVVFKKSINYVSLGINVVFHPLLLIAMTKSIHIPKQTNTELVLEGVKHSVYGEGHDQIRIKEKPSKGLLAYIAYGLYFALFLGSVGFIISMLQKLDFNFVASGLFLLFLTFVSYFGLRIRFNARRWIVNTKEEKFLPFLWDLFTLPIIQLGRWLSVKFQSINIFVFIMDFIIESPFKLVLRFLDQFNKFIKEKKEEIY